MDICILYEDDQLEEFGFVTNIHYLEIHNQIVIDCEKDKRIFINYSEIAEMIIR